MSTADVLERLVSVEAAAHRDGWRTEPSLLLLHARGETALRLATGWTPPATAQSLTVNLAANLVAALRPEPQLRPVVPLHRAVHVLQTLQYVAGESVAAAILAAGPANDGRTVREVVAVDFAGNRYRLTRERGHLPEHLVEPPPAASSYSTLHQALRQMVILTYRLQHAPECPHNSRS